MSFQSNNWRAYNLESTVLFNGPRNEGLNKSFGKLLDIALTYIFSN